MDLKGVYVVPSKFLFSFEAAQGVTLEVEQSILSSSWAHHPTFSKLLEGFLN